MLFRSPAELSCAEVDRQDLLAPGAAGTAVWRAGQAERHDVGQHALRDISVAPHGTEPAFLGVTSYQTRPRYFARFHDALVFPRLGLVMPRPGEFLAESAAALRWGSPRLQGAPGIADRQDSLVFDGSTAIGARVVDQPMLLLCHKSYEIYGHWFMDCLPGAVHLREELVMGRRGVLAPCLQPWQRRSLARLGLADRVMEVADEVVIARDLIFPSYLDITEAALPSSAALQTFAALAGTPSQDPSSADKLLYVSRAGWRRSRQMSNERALESTLAALGFAVVRPELIPLDRQIELFSAARVVIGPHGSGLANIGFAARDCIVVDLLLSSVPDPWIYRLAALCGHRYAYLVTPSGSMIMDRGGVKRADPNARYSIDISAVIRIAVAAKGLALAQRP